MIEEHDFNGIAGCLRLSNDHVEVIVTTTFGPRILYYGLKGGENILAELPDESKMTELGEFKPWGGHRLWAAPEVLPRTYAPDDQPVEVVIDDELGMNLLGTVEQSTGIQKSLYLRLDPEGSRLTVLHGITNRSMWEIELAPWALTILKEGGRVILPQEPYRPHSEYLLPARPLVLWHYTDLSDSRWTIGPKYIQLATDESKPEPQKIGIANHQGWGAYLHDRTLFVKHAVHYDGMIYPDFGSSTETYTAGSFIELETLGHLERLSPGDTAQHVEVWHLYGNIAPVTTEAEIETMMEGRVKLEE
jgi:hypothetical protein